MWTKNCQDFCPVLWGQKSWQFFVHILGETMTSYIHSEIYWPLVCTVSVAIYGRSLALLLKFQISWLVHFPKKITSEEELHRIKARAQYGQSDLNGTSKDNLIMSGTMDLLVFGQHFVKTPKKSIFVMNLKKIKIPDP